MRLAWTCSAGDFARLINPDDPTPPAETLAAIEAHLANASPLHRISQAWIPD